MEKGNSESDRQVTGKEHKEEYKEYKEINNTSDSDEILSYLNQQTGKKYRIRKHIEARLKDGATVEDCKRVINNKIKDPYFIANPKYLNPETLFRPSNFDKYLNEALPTGEKSEIPDPLECPRCGKQIVVESDLNESGCVYCQRMEARA